MKRAAGKTVPVAKRGKFTDNELAAWRYLQRRFGVHTPIRLDDALLVAMQRDAGLILPKPDPRRGAALGDIDPIIFSLKGKGIVHFDAGRQTDGKFWFRLVDDIEKNRDAR